MMNGPVLAVPRPVHTAMWAHLVPRRPRFEEAAFAFVRPEPNDGGHTFLCVEWEAVAPTGFAFRSGAHFELTDETRAQVIKRAHDLGASLVELHSHTGHWPAAFSPSDVAGFRDFVPHVLWRLKGRPYFAVVVTQSGFDAVVWMTNADSPVRLEGILVEGQLLKPTEMSQVRMGLDNDD